MDKYSTDEEVAFIHGYIYALAEGMKKEGLFKDYTINELTNVLILEVINDLKGESLCKN